MTLPGIAVLCCGPDHALTSYRSAPRVLAKRHPDRSHRQVGAILGTRIRRHVGCGPALAASRQAIICCSGSRFGAECHCMPCARIVEEVAFSVAADEVRASRWLDSTMARSWQTSHRLGPPARCLSIALNAIPVGTGKVPKAANHQQKARRLRKQPYSVVE